MRAAQSCMPPQATDQLHELPRSFFTCQPPPQTDYRNIEHQWDTTPEFYRSLKWGTQDPKRDLIRRTDIWLSGLVARSNTFTTPEEERKLLVVCGRFHGLCEAKEPDAIGPPWVSLTLDKNCPPSKVSNPKLLIRNWNPLCMGLTTANPCCNPPRQDRRGSFACRAGFRTEPSFVCP